MKTWIQGAIAMFASFTLAGLADAHFIWVHFPADGDRAEILFGDGIYQDSDPNLMRYVDGLRAWVPDGSTIAFETHPWGLSMDVPTGAGVLAAQCDMGIFSRPGSGAAVKLDYYAKGVPTLASANTPVGTRAEVLLRAEGAELVLKVLFDGQASAGAQVVVPIDRSLLTESLETDANGEVRIPRPRSGAFSVRARVAVAHSGEVDGETFAAEHHYAMLTVASLSSRALPSGASSSAWMRLRAAHETESRFPPDVSGLAGRWSVNIDGIERTGDFEIAQEVEILQSGTALEMPWLRAELLEMVQGRLYVPFEDAHGRYAITMDERDGHPLGRSIDVAGPRKTTFRLAEQRVQSSEFVDGERRFAELRLEGRETESGRYLATLTQRSIFDHGSGRVLATETRRDTFVEAEEMHLPASRTLYTTTDAGVRTARIELFNVEIQRGAPSKP